MPTCFVVMGFGKKTDYPTSRILDLDKSYAYIIRPTVLAAGYECERADEIVHSGNINIPMYDRLLNADLVIADVSTYNANAFYELGVRHALKPFTTIMIAEDKLVFPFDVAQIAVRKYRHLGEGIDFGEVTRMRDELQKAIAKISANAACDSPVYTFVRNLQPPSIRNAEAPAAPLPAAEAAEAGAESRQTVRFLMNRVEAAFARNDFGAAKSLLTEVRTMAPNEIFVVQKLALATYKCEQPTPLDALLEADGILRQLEPQACTDSETLGLYAAVHKRLWELTKEAVHLDQALWALEKGFYVKNDYYNGINLAFLLNVRAALKTGAEPAEAIADFVLAQRTRRQVLKLCRGLLESAPGPAGAEAYWVRAAMAEAWIGRGDDAQGDEMFTTAKAVDISVPLFDPVTCTATPVPPQPPHEWMIRSASKQVADLRALLAESPLSRIT